MQNNQDKTASKENVKIALKKVVESWICASPKRTPLAFARKSKLSETCVRRILSGDALPQPENILKAVVTATGEEKLNSEVLSSIPKDLSEYLKSSLTVLEFEDVETYESLESIEDHLTDSVSKFLFVRAGIGNGISMEEIKSSYGDLGLKIVNRLQDLGLLKLHEGRIKTVSKKDYFLSLKFTKALVAEGINSFYKDSSSTNYLFSHNESVSVKGYCRIMETLRSAHQEVIRISNEDAGNIPMTVGGFMDTMTTFDLFKQDAGEK